MSDEMRTSEQAECLSADCQHQVGTVAYWESLFDEVFGPVLITTKNKEDNNEQA